LFLGLAALAALAGFSGWPVGISEIAKTLMCVFLALAGIGALMNRVPDLEDDELELGPEISQPDEQ
jgi:hypothetical protein